MLSRGMHLCCAALLMAACAVPDIAQQSTEANEAEWLSVYFSDPQSPSAGRLLGGPDEPLQAAIEAARVTIDLAIYDLNMNNLRNALGEAAARGVQVRLVVESDSFTQDELDALREAGVVVVPDSSAGLMHNKFMVIDRYEVWTGSLNYTISSAYGDRNNLVRVQSSQLAEKYLREFEELFSGQFGTGQLAVVPAPVSTVNGTRLEVYFAPDDFTLAHLLALVNGAERQISFMAYTLTSDELAAALLDAVQRGVVVQGIIDAGHADEQGGEYGRLAAGGVKARLDGEGGSLHHKVLIIDETIVVTGSYNFSASAEERNDENTLVIHNAALASAYMQEFWRNWELAQP